MGNRLLAAQRMRRMGVAQSFAQGQGMEAAPPRPDQQHASTEATAGTAVQNFGEVSLMPLCQGRPIVLITRKQYELLLVWCPPADVQRRGR
jgi:hypothetical protein